MTTPSVTVIVLNYNGLEHLEPCFRSLSALDYPPEALELMLVDNGSSDGSVELVRTAFPGVTVVELEENLGFAAGNNVAAQRTDAEYVVFLNNDTKVDPQFVHALVDAVTGDDAVVSAGARMLTWDGESVDYAGGWIIFDGTGLQRGNGEPVLSDRYMARAPTAFACGGAMIVDRAVFLDAGGFDEAYFAVYEDVDLGWRLWLYGHAGSSMHRTRSPITATTEPWARIAPTAARRWSSATHSPPSSRTTTTSTWPRRCSRRC